MVFCDDLETIVIAEGNKHFVFSDQLLMSADKTKVYALIGASRAGSNVRVVVPSTVKSLEPMAMYGAYGMSSLTLPEGLESPKTTPIKDETTQEELLSLTLNGIGGASSGVNYAKLGTTSDLAITAPKAIKEINLTVDSDRKSVV